MSHTNHTYCSCMFTWYLLSLCIGGYSEIVSETKKKQQNWNYMWCASRIHYMQYHVEKAARSVDYTVGVCMCLFMCVCVHEWFVRAFNTSFFGRSFLFIMHCRVVVVEVVFFSDWLVRYYLFVLVSILY